MNPVQQTMSNTGVADSVVVLTVRADEEKLTAEDPEQVMEEMWCGQRRSVRSWKTSCLNRTECHGGD